MSFTRSFYLQLLAGAPLGEAVRFARSETWQLHRDNHTWGAYQCYGDPDYRLWPGPHAAA
jgi:hypothetical protein